MLQIVHKQQIKNEKQTHQNNRNVKFRIKRAALLLTESSTSRKQPQYISKDNQMKRVQSKPSKRAVIEQVQRDKSKSSNKASEPH